MLANQSRQRTADGNPNGMGRKPIKTSLFSDQRRLSNNNNKSAQQQQYQSGVYNVEGGSDSARAYDADGLSISQFSTGYR